MPATTIHRPLRPLPAGAVSFVPLAALGLLPLLPEAILACRGTGDIRSFATISYYEAIASFFLLLPALLLPRWASRAWVLVAGTGMAVATVIATWQAITASARWDLTAYTALVQTPSGVAWGYLRAFGSWDLLIGMALVAGAFAAAIVMHWRAAPLGRREATVLLLLGLLASGRGILSQIRYGDPLTTPVTMPDGSVLAIAEMGVTRAHPVLSLLVVQQNYRATHGYFERCARSLAENLPDLQNPVPVPGATPPRVLVVVIGESASRRHWSLYGYQRDTTPQLAAMRSDLVLFSDAISISVGTQQVFQSMFTTAEKALPVFPLFEAAGYKTHFYSSQGDQGAGDMDIATVTRPMSERRFLNGALDEALLPLIRRAVEEPGRHFILVGLSGSHVRYSDRYPAEWGHFKGSDEHSNRLASYDNSIRYTDHVLAAMIRDLNSRQDSAALLYVSDHAEDVYDSDPSRYLFRSDAVATNAMYEVPFAVWLSPRYRSENPQFARSIEGARDRPYQTRGLYHSLVDLLRYTHPLVRPADSLFSPEYSAPVRRVGSVQRAYVKER